MRERKIIEAEVIDDVWGAREDNTELGMNRAYLKGILETLLDCRELLQQKSKPRRVTTFEEVLLNGREEELLNSLEEKE